MTNRRASMLLLFACAAAASLNILLRSQDDGLKADGMTSLIDPSLDVEAIRIDRKGAPATVLEKDTSWRLSQPYSSSVDVPVVLKLLDAIMFTPVSDAISESDLLRLGRTRSDFSLDDPVVKVTVSGVFGSRAVSFGAPTPAEDGVYAAVEGKESVLTIPSAVLSAVDIPPESFRRRSLFPTGPESVSSFEIKNPTRSGEASPGTKPINVFVREGEGWTKDGKPASAKNVAKFLSDLTAANAVSFVWPIGASNETDRASVALLSGYGLDPEGALTVTLKSLDGTSRQVSFGKTVDENLVYALVQNGSAVVKVPASLKEAAAQQSVVSNDSRLFPVDAKDVQFFSVTDGDVVYALARDDGSNWRFESPISTIADAPAVGGLLKKILSLSRSDLDPGGIGISLATNSAVVRVSKSSVISGGFEQLRSRQMLRVDPKVVKRIVSTPGGPTGRPTAVVYSRDRSVWNVESAGGGAQAEVRGEGIEKVLSSINPLDAERVERLKVSAADLDRYGLGNPYFTVAIDQDVENSVRRNILIGAKTDGGRFATIGSADAVFVISDAVTEALTSPLVVNPAPRPPTPNH